MGAASVNEANKADKSQNSVKNEKYSHVTHNALIYLISQLVSWAITFLTISVIPRTLGEIGVGQMTVMGTVATPVTMLFSCGIENYVIREVGRDPGQAERLFRAAFGLRLILYLPRMAAMFLALWFIHPSPALWKIGSVWILLGIPGVVELSRSILSGRERAKQVALIDFFSILSPLVALPFLRYGPVVLILSNFAVAVVVVTFCLYWLRLEMFVSPIFDITLWKRLIRNGFPFVITSLIMSVQAFLVVFLLRRFTDDSAVGVYSQATKLTGTFLFVPTILGYALLPAMSRLADQDEKEFQAVQSRIFGFLIALGLPVSLLMFELAPPLCHVLYGKTKFLQLPEALQIYSLAIIPIYLTSMSYQFLVARRRNMIWNLILLGSIALQVCLSFLLIPYTIAHYNNGILGSALVIGISETVCSVFAFAVLKVNLRDPNFADRIGRALMAVSAMGAVMWLLHPYSPVAGAALGLAVFLVLGFFLHVITPSEKALLATAIKRRLPGRKGGETA